MQLRELETLSRQNFYLHQLFCLKRISGPNATINFIGEKPLDMVRCRTIAELSQQVGLDDALLKLDPHFAGIPPMTGPNRVLDDDHEVVPNRFMDGGPPSPIDVRQAEANAAKRRLVAKRKAALEMMKQENEREIRLVGSFDWMI
jgi:hypothetical protein